MNQNETHIQIFDQKYKLNWFKILSFVYVSSTYFLLSNLKLSNLISIPKISLNLLLL